MISTADKLKLAASGLLVAAGVAGFYLLGDRPLVVRVVSVLAGLALAAAAAWFTQPGREFHSFSRESVAETKRVVWPTRRETLQSTGYVVAFVVIMALFLWLVDGALLWLMKALLQRGE